jgi:hypothetical protein
VVYKGTGEDRKLRVVFDASCKVHGQLSFNKALWKGTRIQPKILFILLSFRKNRIVIGGDVKQMYPQVMVKKEDRDHQRILWRWDVNNSLIAYQLNTLVFRINPSAFLVMRVLPQEAKKERIQEECVEQLRAILHGQLVSVI